MKKIVLTFGLIAGVALSAMMLLQLRFHDAIGYERGMVVGYTSMVIAFLMIYFGVRSYRDTVANGKVPFGRAFAVGALIGLVASVCYVATWEVIYYRFDSDYLVKYQAYTLDKARANGETEAAIALRKAEMDKFAEMYKNPVINAGVTLMEPLPVALVIALVSAGVLSRRKREVVLDVRTLQGEHGR